MSEQNLLLPALDHVDRQILLALLDDARTSYTDIAKSLGVSPGTIHVRVKKMEKAGIINGASLHLDYDGLGYGFIAFVGIYLSRSSATMSVIAALEKIPEVTVAHVATGRFVCQPHRLQNQPADLREALTTLTVQITAAIPRLTNARWVAFRVCVLSVLLLDGAINPSALQ